MKNKNIIACLSVFVFTFICVNHTYGDEKEINLHFPGHNGPHSEYYLPADAPDVYFDDVTQTVIIDGGGEVSYYDVEIYPATSAIPAISTQVDGTYDTISVSSLAADDYTIIIYSPYNHQFEGEFTIQ